MIAESRSATWSSIALAGLAAAVWLLCFAGPAAAAGPASSPVHIHKVSESEFAVMKGSQVLWRDDHSYSGAALFPKQGLVVYAHGLTLVARTFSGRVRWSREWGLYGVGRDVDCAGTRALLCTDEGPVHGVEMNDPHMWPYYCGETGIGLIDSETGHVRWSRDARTVGTPVWMNDDVFLSVRADLSWASVRAAAERQQSIPLWLEERSVKDAALL